MSYSILYDRVFIRSNCGISPCILSGDNNVWEGYGNRQRRSRSWGIYGNRLGISGDDLREYIKPYLKGYNEHWVSNGKWVTDAGLIRWIESGIKHTVTVEDLIQANPELGYGGIHCYVSVWSKSPGVTYHDTQKMELSAYIKTTEDLDTWINQVNKFIAERPAPEYACFPIIDFGTDKRLIKRFGLSLDSGGKALIKRGKMYFQEKTPGIYGGATYTFTADIRNATVMSYNEAQSLLKELSACSSKSRPTIVSAKVKANYDPHIVQFSNGRYLYKVSASKLYTCVNKSAAKVYPTYKTAEKAALNPKIQLICQKDGLTTTVIPQNSTTEESA